MAVAERSAKSPLVSSKQRSRQAILIFANSSGHDLARRHLPRAFRPFFGIIDLKSVQPGPDIHIFSDEGGVLESSCTRHRQWGANFGEKLNNAVDAIARLGYEEIVIIGRDCPHLDPSDVNFAFDQLKTHRLVIGPDHRGGCYLIGLRGVDIRLLRGIRWQQDADRVQLCARVAKTETLLLRVKQDVDKWSDVLLLARCSDHLGRVAAQFVARFLYLGKAKDLFVDLAAGRVRVRGQKPPPVAALA